MPRKKLIINAPDMSSIMNNLRAVPDERLDAAKMKFYLRSLKEKTGLSEQALILKMLFFAFDNCGEFDELRESIVAEWKSTK